MVACVFAVLALTCYFICYKWSVERIVIDNSNKKAMNLAIRLWKPLPMPKKSAKASIRI
jgi:Na+/melibiose symporter-like transporter